MPIAAVPAYLGKDFMDSSPGMRFGMYLNLWGVNHRSNALLWTTSDIKYEERGQNHREREIKIENKVSALKEATKLNGRDRETMSNLLNRQRLAFEPSEANFSIEALVTAPFTTGLGNEHPLENGFSFLNPYGLPYLPGSGVKGVLRQATRELASGEWGESHGWDTETTEILFGRETDDGDSEHLRGSLIFWDVVPQIADEHLSVEIMTPHQSDYYQPTKHGFIDVNTPHDSGKPNPISFLTVPPKSCFVFHVQCNLTHLKHYAPELALDDRWKTLLEFAFCHAFQWLGFGAKTAVGYGAMESQAMRKIREKNDAVQRELEKRAEQERKQELAQANAEIWEGVRIKYNRNNKSLSVEKNNKTATAFDPKGQELFISLPVDVRKKLESNQYVRVNARVSGNELLDIIK